MKRKRVFYGCAAALIVALTVLGCGSAPKATGTAPGVQNDFESDPNGTLSISNGTSVDMAVFAGAIAHGNYIGSIKAGSSRAFDLKKIPNLPPKSAFLVRAVSYKSFTAKGKTGVSEDDVLYTGLVAYDLTDPASKTSINIPEVVDTTQTYFVYLTNSSRYIIELRLDSPTGETITTLAPGERNKKIWLSPTDGRPYTFFPAYIKADMAGGVIKVSPQDLRGTRAIPGNGFPSTLLNFDEPYTTEEKGEEYIRLLLE
jgi:hypothetical protein